MNNGAHRKAAGFTLIEVVVALAILAISFGILLRLFSNNLRRTSQTEAEVIASSLGRSLLARVGTDGAIADGETSGVFTNGFRWHLRITPYGDAQDWVAWSMSAHQVLAQVTWSDSNQRRSVSFETLRLATLPAGQ
jgi:general secretion pathway protein I